MVNDSDEVATKDEETKEGKLEHHSGQKYIFSGLEIKFRPF